MAVFVSVVTVIKFGERALIVPAALTLVAIFLPPAIPSWHDTIGTGFANGTAIAIPLASLAMFGFARVIHGNQALADARSELARLASENERMRIARDLHDLLGHSLTTITVKAELASRLAHRDTDRALREIAEVAALSRRALGDVYGRGLELPGRHPGGRTGNRSRAATRLPQASPPSFSRPWTSSTMTPRSSSAGC